MHIYNATIAETGKRLLISPASNIGKAETFSSLYPDWDISVTTAGRLASSFPFVSPMARPDRYVIDLSQEQTPTADHVPDSIAFHLADGG